MALHTAARSRPRRVQVVVLGAAVLCALAGCNDEPAGAGKGGLREAATGDPYRMVPLVAASVAAPVLTAGHGSGLAAPPAPQPGPGRGPEAKAAGDVVRTGPQLFLENRNGYHVLWVTAGGVIAFMMAYGSVMPKWQLRGGGDLNGDGNPDLVWQDTVTGALSYWYLSRRAEPTAVANPGTVPLAWTVAGMGDYDGDGTKDILWWHRSSGTVAFWFMNGNGGVKSSLAPYGVPPAWKPTAAGDLDGDGRDDIVWQNADGATVAWFVTGTASPTGSRELATVSPAWTPVGTADFDGDGHQDLLWEDRAGGGLALWYMDGGGSKRETAMLRQMEPGFRVGALLTPGP